MVSIPFNVKFTFCDVTWPEVYLMNSKLKIFDMTLISSHNLQLLHCIMKINFLKVYDVALTFYGHLRSKVMKCRKTTQKFA